MHLILFVFIAGYQYQRKLVIDSSILFMSVVDVSDYRYLTFLLSCLAYCSGILFDNPNTTFFIIVSINWTHTKILSIPIVNR